MIDFDFEKHCYGCSACCNVCPNKAIAMKKNKEGFWIPWVDKKKCIGCGLCDKKCPHLNKKKTKGIDTTDKFIAMYRKKNDKYREYTSSGIFSSIAKKFLENNNYICGCKWDKDMVAEHVLSNDENIVKKMSNSKYVQSDMKNIFKEIKEVLNKNYKVLFCGTPCQVFAVNKFFENNKKGLYTIAIVCHGTPSPEVWKCYKEKLEKDHGSKMVNANFRYKGKYGWITPFSKYDFENNKSVKKLSFTDDPYVIAFGEDILHRNTCYECKFKGTNSEADLVIGDFWGCSNKILKASDNKGASAVIIHSERGKEMLNLISNDYNYEKITIEDMVKENPPVLKPVKYNKLRNEFYNNFVKDKNIEHLSIAMSNKNYKIKHCLYKISIFEYLKRIKYYMNHK